jgi:drug/metabolite transporter (DMT)-like permease
MEFKEKQDSKPAIKNAGPCLKDHAKGILHAFTAVLCLSLTPALVKGAISAGIDPISLLTMRMVVASVVLWSVFLLFFPSALYIDKKGLIGCLCVGMANAISLVCYYAALTRINASVAHVIFSLFPLIALIMLAFRGEPMSALKLIRLAFALIGVYMIVKPGGRVDLVGVILVLLTATFYALHMNLTQWYLKDSSPKTVALYVVSFMALIMSLIYIFRFDAQSTLTVYAWMVILITGLISTAVARIAMFGAIKYIGSGQTALLCPAETLLAVLWAILFLGEQLSWMQLMGGILILASSSMVLR